MEGMFEIGGRADHDLTDPAAPEGKTMAMGARREVQIDALADSVHRHVDRAIVCIDVLLSSTTVVTALAQGRRTLLAGTVAEARVHARGLTSPLLVSEPGLPGAEGPEFCGGPLSLETGGDPSRPLVVVSPVAQLLHNARSAPAVYVACLRNMSATAELLAQRHERVTLVGAGHGSEVRYEDQMVAAWIARKLMAKGFEAEGHYTTREVERWSRVDVSVAALGRGAEFLRRMGRGGELDFVLSRIDDLDLACRFHGGEMQQVWTTRVSSMASH